MNVLKTSVSVCPNYTGFSLLTKTCVAGSNVLSGHKHGHKSTALVVTQRAEWKSDQPSKPGQKYFSL